MSVLSSALTFTPSFFEPVSKEPKAKCKKMLFSRFISGTLKLSNVMLTSGAGSRKVNSGWSADEPHGCQSTVERRLLGFCGIVGLPVLAKLTERVVKP